MLTTIPNKKVSFHKLFLITSSANTTAFIPHTSDMKNAKNPKFLHANCITVRTLGIIVHGNNFVHINKDIIAKIRKSL